MVCCSFICTNYFIYPLLLQLFCKIKQWPLSLMSLAQLVETLHYICRGRSSNPGHKTTCQKKQWPLIIGDKFLRF
jgi:hypothetical protein